MVHTEIAENEQLQAALEQIEAVKYVGAPLLEVQRIAREAL